MSIITRFAPSPTGNLHLGNIRIAIANYLISERQGGNFILRFDDTDIIRSRDKFISSITDDLIWLGITWGEEVKQSDRIYKYQDAAEILKTKGRLYPCYETRAELDIMRRGMLSAGKPPVYNRNALRLSKSEREALEANGRKPHWRFKLDSSSVKWNDDVRGEQVFPAGSLSDPILIREDETFLYTLPSVVDDLSLGITNIIRGEDHVTNTAVQIQVIEALGEDATCIKFGHLPLLTDDSGGGLSKRSGGLSLQKLRQEGVEPLAVSSFLTYLGTSLTLEPHFSLASLSNVLDLKNYSRNQPKLVESELWNFNIRTLQGLPFSEVSARLNIVGADEVFWNAVRDNIASLSDATEWWQVCYGAIEPIISNSEYLSVARNLLPEEPWDENTFGEWVSEVKKITGRKGKELFLPLREALTGRANGPELKILLPLIGREKASHRLMGESY